MPLSNERAFKGVLGNPLANQLGLHIFRILLSDLSCFLRRLPFIWLDYKNYQTFSKNGICVIENFVDQASFEAIRQEILEALSTTPLAAHEEAQGFGQKYYHAQGFDRYDGSSLNRLIETKEYPAIQRLISSKKMNRLTLALFGMLNKTSRYYIYELRHGNHQRNPDFQKTPHKDTFHHTYKLWYFLDEVTLEGGAFEYAYGSHRSTWQRIKWEYQMSQAVSKQTHHPNRGGAFRINDHELNQIDNNHLTRLTVKANTLVIADTKGFHRRGDAVEGTKRIGLYANFRPIAFLPFVQRR